MKNEKSSGETSEETAVERWENEGGGVLNVSGVQDNGAGVFNLQSAFADKRRVRKSDTKKYKMFGSKLFRLKIGLLIFIALNVCCGGAPQPDVSKIEETRRVWKTIPVYPGMTELTENDVPANSTIVITKTYKSDASFADVEAFYMQQLASAGWRLIEEGEIKDRGRIRGEQLQAFTKDDYRLLIQFAGERRTDLGWDYAVELSPSDYWKQKVD